MLTLTLPWWEFVLRGALVYAFLLVMLRMTGKRQTGQLAPFDLVLLLILSNAVQNSMNGGDNSLLGGVILASTLIGLHYVLAFLTYKCKRVEAWIDGTPLILIENGIVKEKVMRSELISTHELAAVLRAADCTAIKNVRVATLENNGQITISMFNRKV